MRIGRIAAGLVACAMVLSNAAPAGAQSASEIRVARQTAGEGLEAYTAGDFNKALGLFDEARQIYPSAQILRLTGYCHLALEHWQKAVEFMDQSMTSTVAPLSADDKKEVQEYLAKALAHFGTVTVTTKATGAELFVDDSKTATKLPLDKPLRLLEGPHTFTVKAPERLDTPKQVKVEGGKTLEVPIEPELKNKPAPPPPPPPPPPQKKPWIPYQKPVGYAAVGTGAALGVAALVTSLSGAHLRGEVANDVTLHTTAYGNNCAKGDLRECQFDIAVTNSAADRADGLRNASIVLGVSALVVGGAGVVLIVMAPKETPPAATGPDHAEAASPHKTGLRAACGLTGGVGLGAVCSGSF